MGDLFQGVEKMFRESFCLCLFFRKSKSLSPIVGKLRTIPVKKAVLGLLNPVTYVNEKYLGLQHTSTDLIQSMMGEGACSNVDHLLVLREERPDGQKIRDEVNSAKLKYLVADLNSADQYLIISAKYIGAYLNVRGAMVTGTVLAATECCEILFPCYDVTPPPPKKIQR